MRAFVTGAAGFIGSNLVDRLLAEGHTVTGWDNFSTGQERFLAGAREHENFTFIRGDNLDPAKLTRAMHGADTVFHFAANADVRFGLQHPGRDLEQNTIATYNVLEAARANGVRCIAFSSTGSVYGEAETIPTPEDAPFPVQTSLYGASKLACEGMIAAYCEGFGCEGYVFRFVSILGERYTHGHVFDFVKQLTAHPAHLDVLGDGRQRKSYLHVGDCVAAVLHAVQSDSARTAKHRTEIYNLGTDAYCEVRDSIDWITAELGLEPELRFTGGSRGWVGDNPFIFLDTAKIRGTGWRPQCDIREGVTRTVQWLRANDWVFQHRTS
jgi:UDP-glucose 4-epimerase